ncbi:uncharacterized protein LOC134535580 isoform X1 [Bacillus rossius redtenbacheri]|uniref:uncharacterized protein LOC134535580 isoform X1 n=1 Tax=Bacillus rossius redtenbacheri TaxID=93214 RepID=UPI002FDC7CF7
MFGVLCLLVFAYSFALGRVTVNHLNSGILFEKQDSLIFSDNVYSIVLDFNLVQLENESKQLDVFLNKVISLNSGHHDDEAWNQNFAFVVKQLQENFIAYKTETIALTSLLPHHRRRQKRGWFNFGGSILKTVFGTLDSHDLIVLEKRLKVVNENKDDISSSMLHHMIVVKNLEDRVINNTILIKNLALHYLNSHNEFYKALNSSIYEVWDKITLISWRIDLNTLFFRVSETLSSARLEISDLRQAIENSVHGQLSSTLLTPTVFIDLLFNIQQYIALPLHMLATISHDNLYMFYGLSKVQAIVYNGSLNVIVNVPLANKDISFEAYNIFAFPFFSSEFKHYLLLNVHDTLLVSPDRKIFPPVFSSSLLGCKKYGVTLCSPTFPFFDAHVSNCEFNLFQGKPTYEICDKSFVSLDLPFLIKTNTLWLFTSNHSLDVTLLCRPTAESFPPLTISLMGSGYISNVSHCDIVSPFFKTFGSVISTFHFNLTLPSIHIPKFNFNLSKPSFASLPNLTINASLIKNINGMLKSRPNGAPFHDVVNLFRPKQQHVESYSHFNLAAISISTLVLICILILSIILFLKLRSISTTPPNPSPPIPSGTMLFPLASSSNVE